MITSLPPMTSLTIALLVAAPGEAPPSRGEVPAVAREVVQRRLPDEPPLRFGTVIVKPSRTMPGYVVCGEVQSRNHAVERFFVVIPGSFAVLERDDEALVSRYWRLNGC